MSVSIKRLHKPSEGGGGGRQHIWGRGQMLPTGEQHGELIITSRVAWKESNHKSISLDPKAKFNRDLSPAANLEERMKINRSNLPHLLHEEDFIFKFGDNLSASRDLL